MLNKAFDRVLIAGALISALLLFFDAVLTTIAVLSRYLFNKPMGWYVELVEYSLIFVTFLSTAWLLQNKGHVKIELVVKRIPKASLRMAIRLFVNIVIMCVAVVLTTYSIIAMRHMIVGHVVATKILSIPRWILVTPVVVGSTLLSIEGLRELVSTMQQYRIDEENARAQDTVEMDGL